MSFTYHATVAEYMNIIKIDIYILRYVMFLIVYENGLLMKRLDFKQF
jgi:hypothetical protein